MANTERYDYAFDPDGDAWPARVLRRVPPGGSVLELGPGPGAMTRVLLGRGHQVTVVENDPDALRALQSLDVQTIAADLNNADWVGALEGRRFDVVLACDVLEHLSQPELVLQVLRDVLQPMGCLIVSLPNIAYAGVVAALRNGIFDYSDKGQLDRTHVRFFTRRSIEKVLMDCGWLPCSWDANRVPLAQSEFAWHWDGLPADLRQHLLAGWPDFDVYQWMVVAAPARDAREWEMAHLRAEGERLRAELQGLRLVFDSEHTSLLEHQKAFAEARQLIARFEQEIREMKEDAARMLADHAALESALSAATQAAQAKAARSWNRRLLRALRLD